MYGRSIDGERKQRETFEVKRKAVRDSWILDMMLVVVEHWWFDSCRSLKLELVDARAMPREDRRHRYRCWVGHPFLFSAFIMNRIYVDKQVRLSFPMHVSLGTFCSIVGPRRST